MRGENENLHVIVGVNSAASFRALEYVLRDALHAPPLLSFLSYSFVILLFVFASLGCSCGRVTVNRVDSSCHNCVYFEKEITLSLYPQIFQIITRVRYIGSETDYIRSLTQPDRRKDTR